MANAPVEKIDVGNGIRASIWANKSTNGGTWHSVTISRYYKDGESFKETTSFRRDDLLFVAKAADLAFRWCFGKEKAERAKAKQSKGERTNQSS